MQTHNPVGTDGFEFLEFTTNDPVKLAQQFESMGFIPVAKHKSCDVTIYQQNDIRFLVNLTRDSMASRFAGLHGASVSAMGFRVKDAKTAYQHALANGAIPYQPMDEKAVYDMPAIYGVGNSLIYFVDHKNSVSNYEHQFLSL